MIDQEKRLAPIYREASTVLERYYAEVKKCSCDSYSRGILLRKQLGNYNYNPAPDPDGVEVVWKPRKFTRG